MLSLTLKTDFQHNLCAEMSLNELSTTPFFLNFKKHLSFSVNEQLELQLSVKLPGTGIYVVQNGYDKTLRISEESLLINCDSNRAVTSSLSMETRIIPRYGDRSFTY